MEIFGINQTESEELEGSVSLDSEPDNLITELKRKAQVLESGTLTSTVLLAAETIQNQRAILLPVAYNHFRSEQESITTRSARWLLRQLEVTNGTNLDMHAWNPDIAPDDSSQLGTPSVSPDKDPIWSPPPTVALRGSPPL